MRIQKSALVRLSWCGIALLVLIGVGSSINRGAAVTTGLLLFDPLKPTLPPSVLKDVERYDEAFIKNRSFTLLHIIAGSIFLLAAPIQVSSYIRKHSIGLHRWCGRITILISLAAGVSALILSIPFAFTGKASTSAVTFFGVLFVIALIKAFVAIRQKNVQKHREWMIRAICIGLGISVVRIVGAIVILITRVPTFELLGAAFWLGWLISIMGGEVYLRHSRVQVA
jgi:uncharacterized membrane protein